MSKVRFEYDKDGKVIKVPDENGKWVVVVDPFQSDAVSASAIAMAIQKVEKEGEVVRYESHPNVPYPHLLEEFKNVANYYNAAILHEAIRLTILGEPKAQKRHRHVSKGGFTRSYDPSASDKADFLSIVQNNAPEKPLDVPLHLELRFYFTRPKSHFKSGKNSHLLKDTAPKWHTGRPDSDNLYKLVSDALNKVYWRDDSIICSCTITKEYSDNPRTEITIRQL